MQQIDLTVGPDQTVCFGVSERSLVCIQVLYEGGDHQYLQLDFSSCRYFWLRAGQSPITGLRSTAAIEPLMGAHEALFLRVRNFLLLKRAKLRRKFPTDFELRGGGSISYIFTSYQQARTHRRFHAEMESFFLPLHEEAGDISVHFPLSSEDIREKSETKAGLASRPEKSSETTALCLHAYLEAPLDDIFNAISSLDRRPAIIATVADSEHASRIRDSIKEFDGNSIVKIVENRGRDVLPFVEMINDGTFERFDYVCKIHTKTNSGSANRLFGEAWRRRALLDLLGGQGQVDTVTQMFSEQSHLGMIGPGALRLPSDRARDPGTREDLRAMLFHKSGVSDVPPTDFFAGTMFWVRPDMLAPVKRLELSRSDFEPEAELGVEGLPHALERFFADGVRLAGGTLGNISF